MEKERERKREKERERERERKCGWVDPVTVAACVEYVLPRLLLT